jgi:hypothetical protein
LPAVVDGLRRLPYSASRTVVVTTAMAVAGLVAVGTLWLASPHPPDDTVFYPYFERPIGVGRTQARPLLGTAAAAGSLVPLMLLRSDEPHFSGPYSGAFDSFPAMPRHPEQPGDPRVERAQDTGMDAGPAPAADQGEAHSHYV